jgi:site-specific recombinase XerD
MEAYQKHLTDFDSHLILKNFSQATRSAYGCALRQFFAYRAEQGHVGTFTQAQARSYILYRYAQGLKWQTINGDYSAMYKFYREVLALPWDVQHIPRPRKERSLPPVLSKQEVQKLIEHGAIFKHQVFMALLYSTGLRLSEALNLRVEDIDGERLQLRVVKGKGAKDRYVSIPDCLLDLLRIYYRMYYPKHYLFNGKRPGQRWANRSAQWSVKTARTAAGVEREVSPHVFRHCYATHHLESGTNLVFLKEQLGHKHLKTTARYISLCKSYQYQVHHPIAGMAISYRTNIR